MHAAIAARGMPPRLVGTARRCTIRPDMEIVSPDMESSTTAVAVAAALVVIHHTVQDKAEAVRPPQLPCAVQASADAAM